MEKTIPKISPIGRTLLLLLSLSLFLAACTGGGGESSSLTTQVGLTIKIPSAVEKASASNRAKSLAPAPSLIAAVAVSVIDGGGQQLASTRVAVSPGQEVTLTLEVPAGRARLFTVQALDEAGAVLFQGEASADLTAGVSTTLAIQMSPVIRPILSISPITHSLLVGKTQRFTAVLTGAADPALIWSVNNVVNGNSVLGTIIPSDNGTTAVYTAPAAIPDVNTVTIKVSSASNPDLAATAVVTLLAPPSTIFVNGATGVDSSECGGEDSPCKTITQGLAVAEDGQTLLVAAGTYPFGSGTGAEPAPLKMKPGVDIQGAGAETTILDLDGTNDPEGAGILGADNATLSGFTIQDDDSIDFHVSLTGTTTIADNRFIDHCDRCISTAVQVRGNGTPILTGNTFGQMEAGLTIALRVEDTASPTITRNTFTGNDMAIEVRSSAVPMIEANSILRNQVGISILGSSNPDLGGGNRESKGGNILSCNATADVTLADTVQAVHAQRNSWDHLPPTVSSEAGSGIDIVGEGIDTEEATAVSPRCLTEPPTVPLNLIATARSQNQINLSWSPAIDNFGEIQYRIERCQGTNCTGFGQIAVVTETGFSDTGLFPATSYTYRVRAIDVDDNVSPFSNAAGATTPDQSAPTPPSNLTANAVSETQINLSWDASKDDVAVTGYRVERCQGVSCTNFAEVSQPTATTFNNTGLSAGTTYSYRVRAVDAANNFSGYSNTVTVRTLDTIAPTPPTNLTANPVGGTQINLTWGGSTDNVGVVEYRIERCQGAGCTNFVQIATSPTTSFNNTGLTPAVSYSYRVRAVDAAGNVSGVSNTATAVTLDTLAPTPPTNLTATAAGESQINLSWGASTDNVAVTRYRVERCQGVNCTNFTEIAQPTTTSFNDTSRSPATTYQYRVRAVDAAGNFSGYSNIAAATTPSLPDTTAPTPPTKLTATALNPSEISLAWEASTDNIAVTGYRVERCLATGLCSEADAGLTLNYTDKGLATATAYIYRVRAYDAAGNLSLYSDPARAVTGSILFKANFDNDALDKPPDPNLPGDPVGDSLTLSTSAGTILVRGSVGELTTKPVELDQTGGTGGVALRGKVAGTPPKSGIYTARWRSLVSSPDAAFAPVVLRDSSGRIVASVAYRPGGLLDYNDKNPNGIGIGWKPNLPQTFEIEVNLDKKVTLLRVDGKEYIVGAPFYEEVATDLAQISMELGTTGKQTLAWDDIEITANIP